MLVKQEVLNSTAKPRSLSWSLVLAVRIGARIWAVVAFILVAGLLSYFLFDRSLLWAGVAALISFLCFAYLFFEHRYELDDEGVRVKTWYSDRRRKWSEFREVVKFTYGVELLTRAGGSRFDFMRSVSLFLPVDDAEILEFIISRVKESKANRSEEQ